MVLCSKAAVWEHLGRFPPQIKWEIHFCVCLKNFNGTSVGRVRKRYKSLGSASILKVAILPEVDTYAVLRAFSSVGRFLRNNS